MKAHSYDMARGTRDQEKQHFMESIFQQTRKFPSEDSTKTKNDFLPSSFSSQSEVPFPGLKEEPDILISLGISGDRRKYMKHFAT